MNGFFLLVAKLQLCYQLLLLLPNFVRRNLLAIREVFVITSNVVLSELTTNEQHGENSLYFEGWKAYNKDPFDLKDNPNGIIQLGLAENQLSVNMIEDWNKRNLQAFIFSITNQDHGLFECLINGIAKLMEKTRGSNVKFDAERIVLTAGATAANETLISCLADPGDAFLIPAPYYTGKRSNIGDLNETQHFLASMLADDEFVKEFLTESGKRLRKRHEKFTSGLEKIGIKCLESNAGLYCWVDLRSLLKEPTLHAEVSLWKLIINNAKLNISPGSSFHCPEAGWFRICFANIDDQTVEIALQRIRLFVDANVMSSTPNSLIAHSILLRN